MSFDPVYGPYAVEIKVQIIHDESEQTGEATLAMGYGSMPSEKDVAERLEKFATSELPKIAPGYRLQTAPELWDSICLEKAGHTFAVPGAFQEFAPVE